MSSNRYVPNRLRGVLGSDESPTGRGSSARGKGRKSRPWRVDAASWKQQLQERKAVYDNFALQEKAEEEKETSATQIPQKKGFESIPLNVLTSTNSEGGGRVDTMLTPRGGGQVETVYTSSTPKTATSSQPPLSTLVGSDQKVNDSNGDNSTSSVGSRSPISSPQRRSRRRSPLPRNKGYRTNHVDGFDQSNDGSDGGSEGCKNDEEVASPRSVSSADSKEYIIDVTQLTTSLSKDSNIGVVNGVANDKIPVKKNKIFRPRSVQMLSRGTSNDTAESIGFPVEEIGNPSSSDYPVDRSSMMEAVESFIDPSKNDEKATASTNRRYHRGADAEVGSSTRRGGRRQQRAPQLSPATSTTSTAGTVMGASDSKNGRSGDDEWSIRPVPSEEDICLEKRRWPLRPEGDTETTASGDTDIVSMNANDVVFTPNPDAEEEMVMRERIALSVSPEKREKGKIGEHGKRSEETKSTKGTSPDPLQKARKTLLLSNLNRSVRSLDISSHSQKDDEAAGDSSIESSYSTSIFVPLRSQRSALNSRGTKEIPLNVLDDHGVYVSKYNKDGIFVPPKNDAEKSAGDEARRNDNVKDKFNEHGAYVPYDKADTVLDQHGEATIGEKSSSGKEETNPASEKDVGELSEGKPTSQEQLEVASVDSKSFADDENRRKEEGSSSVENTDKKIESGEEYDDYLYAVDEIDANRIRLVSDLKQEVSSMYVGHHVCVESVGTSEDANPMDGLHRKRAARYGRYNIYYGAQLKNRISALNTDHHHVVESQRGKKWKERMAMKKQAKKSSTEKRKEEEKQSPPSPLESNVDAAQEEECSKDEQLQDEKSRDNIITNTRTAEEHSQETGEEELDKDPSENEDVDVTVNQGTTEEAEVSNADQSVEKSEDIDLADTDGGTVSSDKALEKMPKALEEQASPSSTTDDQRIQDLQSLPEKSPSPSPEATSEKILAVDSGSTEKESSAVDSMDAPQELNANPVTTKGTNTVTADTVGEGISFTISEESKGNDTDLPVSGSDSNIIQGLPPNKGKKWKDRIKKKKNKRSEKTGVAVKDDSESGEVALDSIETVSSDLAQGTVIVDTPSSQNEPSRNVDSNARPAYNRGISDLTADDKQRALSPTNEAEHEAPPKNVGKKSNKWKNRLAKMKGSKQDNTKPVEDGVQPDVKPAEVSNEDHLITSQDEKTEPNISDRGQILVDFKRSLETSKTEASAPTKDQPSTEKPKTPELESKISTVPQASTTKIESSDHKPKAEDSSLHRNLRQSFDVFDSFLQNGHTNQVDDQSLYTEVTIGQETLNQSGLPAAQASEEELSYMDFTIEETIQPSPMQKNTETNTGPEGKMMSPFMTNLLSSRMFQDDGGIPMMALAPKEEKQEPEKKNKAADSPDTNLKQYPTITVGDDFDDDMTQITMGSLEHENEEDGQEEFFDAESKPFPISPASKEKKSITSNSRKSEGASSSASPVPCSEASKQRIVEILRKEVWSRDKNVVQSAMEELDAEAKNGQLHRAHIVRCGGVMTIMRAMEMNSNCEPIQIASCSILEKLSLDPQTQVALCEMGGISLVVRSMQANIANVELQECACSALATICRHHEVNSSKDLMKDAEDAVPTVLYCMTRYQTNSCIQAKGFQAIANLCSGIHASERLAELQKAGGIMTLTMAIQTPWENKNDQQEAISNLSILLRGLTELNDKPPVIPTGDAIGKETNKDETSQHTNGTESMTHEEPSDTDTVHSYMSEIPNMPMMSSSSINVDDIPDLDHYGEDVDQYGGEIPDLDQYPPTMVSNLEWQNFGEDDLDAGRKISNDPKSPKRGGAQKPGGGGEEQCIIQ